MQEVITKDKDWNMTDPLVHLGASEPVIKSSFKDLLIEMKRFKYQIPLNVLLSKKKEKGVTEFPTVYFNFKTKTVINVNKYDLEKLFQEVLYRLDNWVNGGSAWIIQYIDGECIDISIYNSLSESTYIELPGKLKDPKKGLINI